MIVARVREHVGAWAEVESAQVRIKRLSGLSNACYRVKLQDDVQLPDAETPRVFLYRKFLCAIVDKQIEATVFKCMSNAGFGPKLIF